jgi:hypothetical protein
MWIELGTWQTAFHKTHREPRYKKRCDGRGNEHVQVTGGYTVSVWNPCQSVTVSSNNLRAPSKPITGGGGYHPVRYGHGKMCLGSSARIGIRSSREVTRHT